jgi:hypothetical protein
MAGFKFNSGKKTLEIEGKEYIIDVGNYDQLKSWMSKIDGISRLQENPNDIDSMVSLQKEIVSMILDDYDRLWDLCEHNVFSMMDLVKHLSEFLEKSIKERYIGYGV